jgi:hypothetical protein
MKYDPAPARLVLHRPFHHFDLGTADSILNAPWRMDIAQHAVEVPDANSVEVMDIDNII